MKLLKVKQHGKQNATFYVKDKSKMEWYRHMGNRPETEWLNVKYSVKEIEI